MRPRSYGTGPALSTIGEQLEALDAEAHAIRWDAAPRARLRGDDVRARLLERLVADLEHHAHALRVFGDLDAPAVVANAARLDELRATIDERAARLTAIPNRPTLGALRAAMGRPRVALSLRARDQGEHTRAVLTPRTPSESATRDRPCGVRVTRRTGDGRRIVAWTTCDKKSCTRCGPIVGAEHAAPILADVRAGASLYVADVDEATYRTLLRRIQRHGADAKRYPLAGGRVRVVTTAHLDLPEVEPDHAELVLRDTWDQHLRERPEAHVTGTRRWWREPSTVAAEDEAGTWAPGSEWEVVTAGESYARAAAERLTSVRDLDTAPGWVTAAMDDPTDARLRHALGAITWAAWIDRCRNRRRDGRPLTPPVAIAA